jgi:hypothetical protein
MLEGQQAVLFLNLRWRPDADCAASPLRHRDARNQKNFYLHWCVARETTHARVDQKFFAALFFKKATACS